MMSTKKPNRLYHPLTLIAALAGWVMLYSQLDSITSWLIHDLFQLPDSHFTSALQFFIFEVPKVLLLLILVVFVVGIVRSFFSPEKTRDYLQGKPLFVGNIMAALLGIVTPFCSCSAIPLFLGFVQAGIPVGVTFSFLIAAPMINEVAFVLLIAMFGWKTALIYLVSGLVIAIIAGFFIEKLGMKRYLEDWVLAMQSAQQQSLDYDKPGFTDRIKSGVDLVREIVSKIWIYVLLGIAVGAGAHGYVPDDTLGEWLGSGNWYAVPLAVLIGIPLYSNAAGIVPIVSVLLEKGVSLGTALAFMMSVIGLSLPEIIILKKVLKWQLIAVFVSVVGTGILLVGFLFNFLFH